MIEQKLREFDEQFPLMTVPDHNRESKKNYKYINADVKAFLHSALEEQEKKHRKEIVDLRFDKMDMEKHLRLSEGEVGFCLYKELRGCGEKLAREEWTAKHSNNECKHKAVVLAKAIIALQPKHFDGALMPKRVKDKLILSIHSIALINSYVCPAI